MPVPPGPTVPCFGIEGQYGKPDGVMNDSSCPSSEYCRDSSSSGRISDNRECDNCGTTRFAARIFLPHRVSVSANATQPGISGTNKRDVVSKNVSQVILLPLRPVRTGAAKKQPTKMVLRVRQFCFCRSRLHRGRETMIED